MQNFKEMEIVCQKNAGNFVIFTGVVKVHGKRYGGGGLKYYLIEKFRAYLLKNIKNLRF